MDKDIGRRLDAVLHRIPRAYPGPGGAIAVLRRGEVLARHAWGYANAERRIAFIGGDGGGIPAPRARGATARRRA